jgi:hypothetical protein
MGGVVEGGSGPGLGAGGFGSGGSGIGPGGGWPGRGDGDGLGGSGCPGGYGLGRSGPLNFTSHEFEPASGYGRAARENRLNGRIFLPDCLSILAIFACKRRR